MKQIIVCVSVLFSVFLLAACNDISEPPNDTKETQHIPPQSKPDTTKPTGQQCPSTTTIPQTLPSKQRVSFVFTNKRKIPVFVVAEGAGCSPFAINGHSFALPFQIECGSLAAPPSAHAKTLHELKPGTSFTLTWDGRSLKRFKRWKQCKTVPFQPCEGLDDGRMQPMPPGTYTIQFAILEFIDESPYTANCNKTPGRAPATKRTCDGNTVSIDPYERMGTHGKICHSNKTLQTTFTLPKQGNHIVNIAITNNAMQ